MCTVTYERQRKAPFKEDAGRAHEVQHVAVLHQSTQGFFDQLILHILILLSLQLQTALAHCPHLTPERSPSGPLSEADQAVNPTQ